MAPSRSKKNKAAIIQKPRCKACEKVVTHMHCRSNRCPVPQSVCKKKSDVMESFRPKKGLFLDYNISQTDAKYDAGNVQVHIRQTKARYIPPPPGVVLDPPPKPPKIQYGHGAPPVWVFADEIWREKQDQMQVIYQQRLKEYIARRKKTEAEEASKAHNKLMKLIGPDWYQELSPKQMRTVEQLQYCIIKDLKYRTIVNTQDNIAELGILLRPSHMHIEVALLNCCACPVEFLLILYQLMNPKRTSYSINDRLLLSGVVHLTMKETLKELHIRIPSPPPKPKPPKVVPKKTPQPKVSSPYLEHCTFKPQPRKFTGIYYDKHRQHPESPYFSYIEELKRAAYEEKISEDSGPKPSENQQDDNEGASGTLGSKQSGEGHKPDSVKGSVRSGGTSLTKVQEEIKLERCCAQKKYESMFPDRNPGRLGTPSVYTPCEHNLFPKKSKSEESKEGKDIGIAIEVTVTTTYKNAKAKSNKCACIITVNEKKRPKRSPCTCLDENIPTQMQRYYPGYAGSDFSEGADALAQEAVDELIAMSTHFIINGIVARPGSKPIFILGGVIPEGAGGSKKMQFDESEFVTVTEEDPYKCDCEEPIDEMLGMTLCRCQKCMAKYERKQKLIRQYAKCECDTGLDASVCGCPECMQKRKNKELPVYLIAGSKLMRNNQLIAVNGGVVIPQLCECKRRQQNLMNLIQGMKRSKCAVRELQSMRKQYIIAGVVQRQNAKPIFILGGTVPPEESRQRGKDCDCKEVALQKADKAAQGESKQKLVFVIAGSRLMEDGELVMVIGAVKARKTCDCLQKYKDSVQDYEDNIFRRQAVNELVSMSIHFVICGVVDRPDGKPIFILGGVLPGSVPPGDASLGDPSSGDGTPDAPQRLNDLDTTGFVTVTERVPSECDCKAEVQHMIDTSVCRCDKCMEELRKKQKTLFMIASSQMTDEEQLIPVIGGVKPRRTCKCLERYQEYVAQYEDMKLRKAAIDELKSMCKQFIIGGIVTRPGSKPIFILGSTVPIKESPSVILRKQQMEEERRIANMPKPIPGGLKCVIGGVRETPEGNIFMIQNVVPKPDCRCMEMYKKFQSKHERCMDLYEKYKKKIDTDIESYMQEIAGDERYGLQQQDYDDETQLDFQSIEDGAPEISKDPEITKDIEVDEDAVVSTKESCDRTTCVFAKEICQMRGESSSYDAPNKEDDLMETNLTITLEINKDKKFDKERCICMQPEKCTCGGGEDIDVELKRFILLEKFPCSWKKQKEILQKALASLEEDGFPLAKLPEAYKLPHFKLWMQLRCGKSWTLSDKIGYVKYISRDHWMHTRRCQRKVLSKIVDLHIPLEVAENMTYSTVFSTQRRVREKLALFYRRLRQNTVEDGREFFPTMFTYEFPTPAFRDCYFAYTPAKEEEVHPLRIWKAHEYKHMSEKESCS